MARSALGNDEVYGDDSTVGLVNGDEVEFDRISRLEHRRRTTCPISAAVACTNCPIRDLEEIRSNYV